MIVAVVPALDERAHIGRVIATMPALVDRIVVVDDGSGDGTAEVARAHGARVDVMMHARPQGVGAAIAAGVLRARSLGADVAVVLAGDGQMDPLDLPAVVAPIARDQADLVKGNRLAWPAGALAFPLVRLLGVVALSAATRAATGLSIDDAQCGYAAFGRRAMNAIDWARLWPRFGYPNDLLIKASRLGLRVAEVPVRPIYAGEQSHMRPRHWPAIGRIVGLGIVARVLRR